MNKIFNIILLLFLSLNIVFKLYGKNQTYLNTKNIIFNEENETIELKENTKINIEGNSISLDDGVLDYKNNTFEILGEFLFVKSINYFEWGLSERKS
jgi:lipopolysaccharide export system protein LptA